MNANERKYKNQCSDDSGIYDIAVLNSTVAHLLITSPAAMTTGVNHQIFFICVHLRDVQGCTNAASAGCAKNGAFADIF